ncbi:hypothetical protein VN96_2362 [Lactococcus cremoris]|nr:hypothetical protein VN96_2362 [Lactococcus cremoris]
MTVLTILLTGAVKVSADSTQAEIYRLYNKNTGEHFYTSSAFERDSVNKSGWSYEGVGWIAPKKSSTPIYRVFNPNAKGGDHYYTKSNYEANQLVKKDGNGITKVNQYSILEGIFQYMLHLILMPALVHTTSQKIQMSKRTFLILDGNMERSLGTLKL